MGNRGIEYRTTLGTAVRATVGGTVTFVGVVANTMYVVLRTTDGLLVTHGRLRTAQVRLGEVVQLDQQLGEASDTLYIGVRRAGRYLDPAQCSGDGRRQIRAVLL
jgi:septal ring factor EnvC (AmiA/AmiB activator)